MKRTIEIEDTLDNRVECAIDEVKSELENYLKENPDTDSLPCLINDLDYSGAIHSIVDSSVPIYTHEIRSTWYLRGSELEDAYDNAGVGDNPMRIYAFERVERMLQDRLESLKRTIPNGDIDHPNANRVYEIGMFLDEIHIMKRQVRQAHAETLTK